MKNTFGHVFNDTTHALLYGGLCTLGKVSAFCPSNQFPKNLVWEKITACYQNSTFSIDPTKVKGSYFEFFKNPKILGSLGTFVAANGAASVVNQIWGGIPGLKKVPKFLRSAVCLGGAIYLSSIFSEQYLGIASTDVINLAIKTYSFAFAVNIAGSAAKAGAKGLKWIGKYTIKPAGVAARWLVNRVSWNSDLYSLGAGNA